MIKGFKEFIARGNAIDLAVGLVIGAAFTAIVTALVEQVLNPLIGGIFGEPNFDDVLVITMQTGLADAPAEIRPFAVLTALLNFLIIAMAIYFMVVMPMNKFAELRAKGKEAEPDGPSEDVLVLREIRDMLARQTGQNPANSAGAAAPDGPPAGSPPAGGRPD